MGIKHDTKKSKRHSTQIQETPISHKLTYLGHARAMSDARMFFDRREVPRRGHGAEVIGARREEKEGERGRRPRVLNCTSSDSPEGEGGGRRGRGKAGGGQMRCRMQERLSAIKTVRKQNSTPRFQTQDPKPSTLNPEP